MAPKKPLQTSKKGSRTFDFCEVCRRNHDQGRRHNYSPSHIQSLSSLLSKFRHKISQISSFLQNPRIPNPNLDRIWCVFCEVDVCGDVIHHLASSEHLRNVKGFLRRHGGGLDRVDSFRVSAEDLIKWEEGCKSLIIAASTSSEAPIGPSPGPSKDIQHKHTSKNMDSFANHSISYFHSNAYNSVIPLQSLTNEGEKMYPEEVGVIRSVSHTTTAALSVGLQESMGLKGRDAIQNVTISLTVLQKITQISFAAQGSQANVHTGALPPWLDASEEKDIGQLNIGPCMNKLMTSAQTGKSRKLNPKRVGAAWAEKRRLELEMEKRGERVPDTIDANWLPNFGRVWQAGSRKESRKEFETEKRKSLEVDNQPELSLEVQPYISKRMKAGSPNRHGAVCGYAEDVANAL